MRGTFFRAGSVQFFANCHTRWTRQTSFRRNPNNGKPIYSLVVVGLELSWWRAA